MRNGRCEECGYGLPEAGAGVGAESHYFCAECGRVTKVIGPREAFWPLLARMLKWPLIWQASVLVSYIVGASLCRWTTIRHSEISMSFLIVQFGLWIVASCTMISAAVRGGRALGQSVPKPERMRAGWGFGVITGTVLIVSMIAVHGVIHVLQTQTPLKLTFE